tara:strand:+ start:241 stop:1023 length:783 start_codon:yes stop_codon:yes gene_type:complete
MNINNIINDLSLVNGESKRLDCPSCNRTNTFTVTNNMGTILYNCYSNNCSLSGKKNVKLSSDDIRKSISPTTTDNSIPFVKPDCLVKDNKAIAVFCKQWDIDPDELGLLYDVKESRVVFPVLESGVMVDASGRSITHRIPKWKRYGKSSLPYSYGNGSVAVVVEDCISAAIVGSDVYVGVAVLGTSLSEEHKRFLSQFSTAIVALDPDALPKTIQFTKELRSYVDTVVAFKLTNDLKYRHPNDIEKLTTLGVKYGININT